MESRWRFDGSTTHLAEDTICRRTSFVFTAYENKTKIIFTLNANELAGKSEVDRGRSLSLSNRFFL